MVLSCHRPLFYTVSTDKREAGGFLGLTLFQQDFHPEVEQTLIRLKDRVARLDVHAPVVLADHSTDGRSSWKAGKAGNRDPRDPLKGR